MIRDEKNVKKGSMSALVRGCLLPCWWQSNSPNPQVMLI